MDDLFNSKNSSLSFLHDNKNLAIKKQWNWSLIKWSWMKLNFSELPIHGVIDFLNDVEEKSMIDCLDEDVTYIESLFSIQIWDDTLHSNQQTSPCQCVHQRLLLHLQHQFAESYAQICD